MQGLHLAHKDADFESQTAVISTRTPTGLGCCFSAKDAPQPSDEARECEDDPQNLMPNEGNTRHQVSPVSAAKKACWGQKERRGGGIWRPQNHSHRSFRENRATKDRHPNFGNQRNI